MLNEYEIPMDIRIATRLTQLSKTSCLSKESLKRMLHVVPLGGATLAVGLVLIWIFINWLLGFVTTLEFGWNSQYRPYVLWLISVFSYSWVLYEVAKSCGPSAHMRTALKKDLEGNIIKVAEYSIYDAKVFEEPEHGGFIYFVRTSDDRVLALFDSESQDLSIEGEDPRNSAYKIRRTLKIFRAPNSNIIVDEQFEGDLVQIPDSEVFTTNTNLWPEHGDVVRCKWEDISKKYGARLK